MTSRLRLDIRYDGSDFHGWAKQEGLRTVQGELETGLSTILRQPVSLVVAGRTDAGVHADGQVAHLDLLSTVSDRASYEEAWKGKEDPWRKALPDWESSTLQRFRDRINGLLATSYSGRWRRLIARDGLPQTLVAKGQSDLLISEVSRVSDDFDARFSAVGRSYRYILNDQPSTWRPCARGYEWWVPFGDLRVEEIWEAAQILMGEHDFLSFCRPREGATTIRTLRRLDVTREERGDIAILVEADAFCHSMVRSLVGALVEVGRGARDAQWIRTLIARPGRSHGVPVAPARGLTLTGVEYPPEEEWASRSRQARNRREPLVNGDGYEC